MLLYLLPAKIFRTKNASYLIKDEESVKAILEVYGKFNNADVANYGLRANEKTILGMLDITKTPDTVLSGIKAARLIELHSAVDKLQFILTNAPTELSKNEAQLALNEINANPGSAFPLNSAKWED